VDFSGLRVRKNDLGEADFNQQDLEAVMIEEEPLHALAVPILEKSAGRRTVVFASGVAHAHLLAAILNRERKDSAVALDGTTDPEKRRTALCYFAEGRVQFLTNYNILTEGWDCPNAAVVAMGRPTKSQLVYTQMLGRVLRPLDGVVDGYPDAADRRMAILTSEKPYALCLDFVGNSKHKLVTAVDVLGGEYDPAVIDRARKNIDDQGLDAPQAERKPADVIDQLKKARSSRGGGMSAPPSPTTRRRKTPSRAAAPPCCRSPPAPAAGLPMPRSPSWSASASAARRRPATPNARPVPSSRS
jgi:superfamily II DNA or RNA helicase